MIRPLHPRFLTQLGLSAGLLLALAAPAQATLNGPLTLSLVAPGGDATAPGAAHAFTLSQSVAPATGVTVGDGSDIGSYMLSGESIQFVDNSIRLHVAAGWDDGLGQLTTGVLGDGVTHGRYQFDGLSITGQAIVGITVHAFDDYGTSGFSGVISGTGVSLVSPNSLTFNLDDLRFVDRGNGSSNAFGEFRIDLLTQPVPEPASWALMLGGLVLLGQLARRHA
jgi:hypothetical protein